MQLLRFLASKIFIINLALALIITIAFVSYVLWWIDDYTLHQQEIVLPDLKNKSLEEANDLLHALKLKAEVWDSVYSRQHDANVVLAQIPKPTAKVKENRTIYLTINASEPPKVKMPDLIDKSVKQAMIELENRGLQLGELSYVPDIAFNAVLKQQINGETASPGSMVYQGSVVDLVLGEGIGNTSTQIPFLLNLNLADAKEKLVQASLNSGSIIYMGKISDTTAAKVVKQIPAYQEGNMLRLGQSVDLFLAQDFPDSLQYLLYETDETDYFESPN